MSEWHLDSTLADDSHPIAHLELSELRLLDDANYPWLLLVPRVPGARELTDLDRARQTELLTEIDRCARIVQALFHPHKLNIAMLGNRVEQLHVHLIARYRDDPAWPRPVWGTAHALPYAPEPLVERVARLQEAVAG